jgi:large subunit ribosomal protein L19
MKISPVNTEERKKMDIKAGDTLRVWQRIEESGKTRRQAFEGLVIARKHGSEAGATFTIRKISGGIGVELTLPLYSPNIEKIELIRRPKRVRRAKLYYLRERAARQVRKKMRQMKQVGQVLTETKKEEPKNEEDIETDKEEKTEPKAKEEPAEKEKDEKKEDKK